MPTDIERCCLPRRRHSDRNDIVNQSCSRPHVGAADKQKGCQMQFLNVKAGLVGVACGILSRTGTITVVLAAAVLSEQAALAQLCWDLSHGKISDTEGNFTGTLDDGDAFGEGLTAIGDLDGDGVSDLAVGASFDDDGGNGRGAVWVLFLNNDSTVKSHQKISGTEGNFHGVLDNTDNFGRAIAPLGDLDGDGVLDLAVSAPRDDDGGINRGAVWILFLDTDGAVKSHQKISSTSGGFTGNLEDFDAFGSSLALLGDLDGDGVVDLAVGASGDDDGGSDRGAVWVLFLNANGTVKSHQKISGTEGGFTGVLDDDDEVGKSVAVLGDLDRDGVADLAVGAEGDDDGGSNRGAVWILFLNSDGTVKSHQKISSTEGEFTGDLVDGDWFSSGIALLSDLDGDGVDDLAVGADGDDDAGDRRGAVWILFLDTDGTVKSHQKISDIAGDFTGDLDDGDRFGSDVAAIGDVNGDGKNDLAVGATGDDDGGVNNSANHGAVWILFPYPGNACVWDCAVSDGTVDILDFLGLLGQWTQVCTSCDFDGGGAGINDFLELLANWGPCP